MCKWRPLIPPHNMDQQQATPLFLRSWPPSQLISWYDWLHQLRRHLPKHCTTHIIKRLRYLCRSIKCHYRLNMDLALNNFLYSHTLIRLFCLWDSVWTYKHAAELWTVRTGAERLMSIAVFPGITGVMMFRCTNWRLLAGCLHCK